LILVIARGFGVELAAGDDQLPIARLFARRDLDDGKCLR
jgi:hypothetical protein